MTPGRRGTVVAAETGPLPRARTADRVRVRYEPFGAVVYVGRRDHFFALDPAHAKLVKRFHGRSRDVEADDLEMVKALAGMGILTTEPATPERAFYGRSLVGSFADLPVCSAPLVVNCLVTAHCPLRCRYCHADDLMTGYREAEDARWLTEVTRVARATPAMVGVVTGGEPLSRADRAEHLIKALARDKSVVLDTSGVGDFHRLVPVLQEYGVHVRVSLDSADQSVNDALRPINRQYLPQGTSSHNYARDTIRKAIRKDIACSVQTVVTARNGALPDLLGLRNTLVDLGVQTWTLHVVVPAGKAADPAQADLLSGPDVLRTLEDLVWKSAADDIDLDIRVTSTHRSPNSVLLISAKGELCVEGSDGGGKTTLRVPRLLPSRRVRRVFLEQINSTGHASRYLNGTLGQNPRP
jgi:molybdenum cofactor biosynthesis enzyme MoaA